MNLQVRKRYKKLKIGSFNVIKKLLSPSPLEKTDSFLLLNYPFIWSTSIHYLAYWFISLSLFISFFSLILPNGKKDVSQIATLTTALFFIYFVSFVFIFGWASSRVSNFFIELRHGSSHYLHGYIHFFVLFSCVLLIFLPTGVWWANVHLRWNEVFDITELEQDFKAITNMRDQLSLEFSEEWLTPIEGSINTDVNTVGTFYFEASCLDLEYLTPYQTLINSEQLLPKLDNQLITKHSGVKVIDLRTQISSLCNAHSELQSLVNFLPFKLFTEIPLILPYIIAIGTGWVLFTYRITRFSIVADHFLKLFGITGLWFVFWALTISFLSEYSFSIFDISELNKLPAINRMIPLLYALPSLFSTVIVFLPLDKAFSKFKENCLVTFPLNSAISASAVLISFNPSNFSGNYFELSIIWFIGILLIKPYVRQKLIANTISPSRLNDSWWLL